MFKMKTTTLFILATLSSSTAFAYEVKDNINTGLYGEVTFVDYDGTGTQILKSNTNAYVDLTFKEFFGIYLDVNHQTNNYEEKNGFDSDFSETDLYQGYASFDHNSFQLKAGRFADFHVKGDNALDLSKVIIDSSISPLTVLGQAKYSTIDGLAVTYRAPLNRNGVFSSTFYGGMNTQKYANDLEKGMESTSEGSKYGVHFDIKKEGHSFIVGAHVAELDKIDLSDLTLKSEKSNDYFNFYTAYKYEGDVFFSDNAFMYGKFDEGDIDIEQTVVDLKIGTNMKGFKPFIGFNSLENMDNKYTTMSYGIRYDFHGFGAILKKEDIKQEEGEGDVEDTRFAASIHYKF